MKKRIFILTLLALLLALPAAAFADGLGPPGGTIYAHDVAYKTIGTPTDLPGNAPDDSFDVLYHFPDCVDENEEPACAAVSDAAPGDADYNGGRWIVVDAYGITEQLTNAEDVRANATMMVETGVSLECPLISKK
jgi:hypothetical protein